MRKNARLPKELGKKIKKARKNVGLTQDELAHRIKVSRVYMGYIEQGRNTPSLEVLERISKALSTSLSKILE